MIEGKPIHKLKDEIYRRARDKRDFLVTTSDVHVDEEQRFVIPKMGDFSINEHAHGQIAERLRVPKVYYDRLRLEYPDLWATNVNTLFREEPENRMVRTLDGRVRAFLSDRYRRIDNEHIAETVLPILEEYEGLRIISSEVTERRLYITAVYPKLEAKIKEGDIIQAGLQISNSEIGAGSWSASYLAYRLKCKNGLKLKELGVKQYHIGKRVEEEGELEQFYSEETKRLDDSVILLKTRDIIRALLDGSSFALIVKKLNDARLDRIESVENTVMALATNYQLKEAEKVGVVKNIYQEGDENRYGLANAVSFMANEADNYDRAMELQSIGGKIIDLTKKQWEKLAA